ncbi:cytochrome P450 6A1 [Cordyceps militaris CM01]|uniref:Cytochrome P450 6A1 n=1 Tax=Cordyceps militaris (strain CM01) TaxID=983644 RepID=G3JC44_CORMM|nr:cytochrome P450 6A1 [Cordyceps militaris CM01]EGX94559.1 cytochrome P450 6A1 [Cordyceps militaris CM01]
MLGWLPWWFAAAALPMLCTVILAMAGLVLQRPKLPENAPKLITGWPILGSIGFYFWRHDFLEGQRKKHGEQPYTFYYGRYPIVSLAGEAGRAFLFTAQQLSLHAGHSALLALPSRHQTESAHSVRSQIKLFRKILTRERFSESLPSLVTDTDLVFRQLSMSGRAVPLFPVMCRLIYQLMHRVAGIHEVAESDKLLDSSLKHFSSLEKCTALQVMFNPWPLPGMLSKLWAAISLHRLVMRVMKERRKTERVERDTLQLLMDYGEEDLEIVKCIISVLFAGLLNTGISSTWLLCYLAENRVWYEQVQAEVDMFVNKNRRTPEESVREILQRVPYNDWDTQFPSISVCLRETLRLGVYQPAYRRNMSGEDVEIPGTNQVIPKESFAFFSMGEVHMDETIYPNASEWEPARHLAGREEGAHRPHEFVGWGSGLHPCGSKAATLEITVAVVTMVALNEFWLVERNGEARKRRLPRANKNNLSVNLPTEEIYLKCSPRTNKHDGL